MEEHNFHIFGDPAYGVGPYIMSPFSGIGEQTEEEQTWNSEMSAVHIEVEHGLGLFQIHGHFSMLDGRCIFILHQLEDIIV